MFQRKIIKRTRRLDDIPEGEQWCNKHNAFVVVDESSDDRCHEENTEMNENKNNTYDNKYKVRKY